MIHLLEKKDTISYFAILLIIFIFFFQSVKLSAQGEIPYSLIKEQIQYIQNILDHGKITANRWQYGWLVGYSAATAGQGAEYFMSRDLATRQDMALGAATSFLGALGQLFSPLDIGTKADRLAQVSESTTEDQLKKLSSAEEFLKATAIREKQGRSLQNHMLCGAVNISSGLITWIGFKRSVWAGVGNFALNTIITEVQIWTQPTQTMKDYQNYCRKYNSGVNPKSSKLKPTCYMSAYPGGIAIRIMF